MSIDHDSSYKALFSAPELVRDLILGFIPDEWLHSLDYSTLEKVPGSYVSEDFKQREDDVVWKIKVGGQWLYLYLLIEFQSSVDKYMSLRMMVYQGLLYQDLIKSGEVLSDGLLPPILPIVLYNGQPRWTAATDIFDLIPPVPGLVEQFKPKAKYLLIDENAYNDSDLASLKNLVAAVFRIEHPGSPQAMQQLITMLTDWLSDRPDLRRMFALWIRATLMRKPEYAILLPQVHDLQELNTMLAQKLEEWALAYKAEGMEQGLEQGLEQGIEKGIQTGMQKGLQKGETLSLQKLLAKRFSPIPAEITAKIATASLADIECWFDKALDADQLSDIFDAE
ncbi:Rpn family recombination-promoting nuclease/putative transposase [Methylomonas paludis]|uniref:Rpn family recombination-promoting nuclease/putative transposase n=1 Tax=Methylomonas paludis TaxID=1173101 RepID=A0A975MPX4_9GAMM|nr:Rpn family recombination-promoting nuclease/putative transposase [Methylomonas paludis]QWF71873.1 Rpn family recombination-promoting nuclease/putative transposase [Methylomonas paludis]